MIIQGSLYPYASLENCSTNTKFSPLSVHPPIEQISFCPGTAGVATKGGEGFVRRRSCSWRPGHCYGTCRAAQGEFRFWRSTCSGCMITCTMYVWGLSVCHIKNFPKQNKWRYHATVCLLKTTLCPLELMKKTDLIL